MSFCGFCGFGRERVMSESPKSHCAVKTFSIHPSTKTKHKMEPEPHQEAPWMMYQQMNHQLHLDYLIRCQQAADARASDYYRLYLNALAESKQLGHDIQHHLIPTAPPPPTLYPTATRRRGRRKVRPRGLPINAPTDSHPS